jgi:putative transposase
MPTVKNVGEPCAGEPHARFDAAAGGNQASRASTCRAAQAPLADPTNVHQIRTSMRYVNYRDRKKVTAALRPIYTAPNADVALEELERFDETWGAQYPMITAAWQDNWDHIIPFLSLPGALRRVVYTTNTIEALHRQIRKAIKTRGHFPDEQAATKLIYLTIERSEGKWRSSRAWTPARAALKIHFGDRFPG